MNHRPATRTATLAIAIATCGVLVAGVAGLVLLSRHTSDSTHRQGPMLLAPMIGVIDTCVLTQDGATTPGLPDLQSTCTGPNGSAAALVESTLSALQPRGNGGNAPGA